MTLRKVAIDKSVKYNPQSEPTQYISRERERARDETKHDKEKFTSCETKQKTDTKY